MKKTCKTCCYYSKESNCCKYKVCVGDTVAPNCMFVERYRIGYDYLDFAFDAKDLIFDPNIVAYNRREHLRQHGYLTSVFCGMHSIPFAGDCPVWSK